MKKRILALAAALTVSLASLTAPIYGATITDKNIKDGLEFCKSYPIVLQYEGSAVTVPSDGVPPVIITPDGEKNGWTLIPARALFEAAGATVEWTEATQTVTVKNDDTTVILTIGASSATVNGEEKALDIPALIIDHDGDNYGSTMIPVRFVAENLGFKVEWDGDARIVKVSKEAEPEVSVIDPSELPRATEQAAEKVIVIDPGHGGRDTGSIAHEDEPDELYEKSVNLKAAFALEKYLKQAGIKTALMTRDDDTYLGLYDRPSFANSQKADLFVSVHNNSAEYETPHGTEVHYYEKVDEEGRTETELYGISSKSVAESVQKEMVELIGTYDRGVKSSPKLAVLNKTAMPAIIIEGAFLSNESDLELLRTDDFAEKYGFAAAKGIVNALNEAFPD